jgi:hypothetical protein
VTLSLTPHCDIPDTLCKERRRNVAAVRRGTLEKTVRRVRYGVSLRYVKPGKNCRFFVGTQGLILRVEALTTSGPGDYIPALTRRRCFGAMARLRSPSLFTR